VEDTITKLIILHLYNNKGYVKQSRVVEAICKYNYSKPTVLKRINELIDKKIIIPNYASGIKSPEITLDKDKVKIYYNFKYYLHFYICVISSILFSTILSLIYDDFYIVLGSIITSIFVLIKCMYDLIKNEHLKIVKIYNKDLN